MGILNITPDSFSDGSRYLNVTSAVKRAQELVAAGASIVDVGGVSTRPGSADVSVDEELSRIGPVLAALRPQLPPEVLISCDTSNPNVASQCAKDGLIDIVNDVFAGRRETDVGTTFDVATRFDLALVLMHMQGTPETMQQRPHYKDCVAEVASFLRERYEAALRHGVKAVAVDPGIGFGKTTEHNLALLSQQGIETLSKLPCPLVIGLSRKRFLSDVFKARGECHDGPPELRDVITKEFELAAFQHGAKIVRSHVMPSEVKFRTGSAK